MIHKHAKLTDRGGENSIREQDELIDKAVVGPFTHNCNCRGVHTKSFSKSNISFLVEQIRTFSPFFGSWEKNFAHSVDKLTEILGKNKKLWHRREILDHLLIYLLHHLAHYDVG